MSSIVKTTEDRISELQDKTREFIQFQQQQKNILKKKLTVPQGPVGK